MANWPYKTYGGYIGSTTTVSTSHKTTYDFGKGDFSVSFLLSLDLEGIVIGCVQEDYGEEDILTGWYIEICEDHSIYFYTGDGIYYSAARSVPVPELHDGFLYFITCKRTQNDLFILLEEEKLDCSCEGVTNSVMDVTCGEGIRFGGIENHDKQYFCGVIKNVTLWNKAIDEDDSFYAYNDILPEDKSNVVGWWSFDCNLLDKSPVGNPISHASNLHFVEVYDITQTEDDGYVYECIEEGEPLFLPIHPDAANELPIFHKDRQEALIISRSALYESEVFTPEDRQRLADRRRRNSGDAQLKRKIKVHIDDAGVFMGSINDAIEYPIYPQDVKLDIITPSGSHLADLGNTDTQWIVTKDGNVWQFIIMDSEPGDWTIEILADEGKKFYFDYQYIRPGTSDDLLVKHMNRVYSQFQNSTAANGISPESFMFMSYARIIALSGTINTSLEANPMPIVPIFTLTIIAILGSFIALKLSPMVEYKEDISATNGPNNAVIDCNDLAYAYRVAKGFYECHGPTFDIYKDIMDKFNCQTPTDPKKFYKKSDLEKFNPPYLHLDLGGEGCFSFGGLQSGWAGAINLNKRTTNSQRPDLPIPNLVQLKDWDSPFPFENNMVDRITAQGIDDLTNNEIREIVRCIRKDEKAQISFWHILV